MWVDTRRYERTKAKDLKAKGSKYRCSAGPPFSPFGEKGRLAKGQSPVVFQDPAVQRLERMLRVRSTGGLQTPPAR